MLLCSLLLTSSLGAISQSSQGTDFWVAFLQNCDIDNSSVLDFFKLELTVTSTEESQVVVENESTGFKRTVSLSPNSTETISIPFEEYNLNVYGKVVDNKTLHVTSTTPISVYFSNAQYHSMESSIALPTSSCGSYYVTQMNTVRVPVGPFKYFPAIFCVVATEDNTEVLITPTLATGSGFEANKTYTVKMNKGDVYAVETTKEGSGKDFSGSQIRVKDDKKVAVFVGNQTACVPEPTTKGDGDNLMDVAYPVSSWGKKFMVVPLRDGLTDMIKCTAADNGASVYLNGEKLVDLDPFQSYTFPCEESDGAFYIESTEPIELYQYMTSVWYSGTNRVIGGPSFQYIAPLEQALEEIVFATFDNYEVTRQNVNLIINAEDKDLVTLDGEIINEVFKEVEALPGYLYTSIRITDGSHVLKAPHGVVANVYGLGSSISYAYSAGSSLKEINPIDLFADRKSGQYKVLYDGNGATSGTMKSHIYEIGLDETTQLDANAFERSYTVSFDANGGDDIESIKSNYRFGGWLHEQLLTEVTNNMEKSWNLISSNQYGSVYDLLKVSNDANVNSVSVECQDATRERLYSMPIYTPTGDFNLSFKVCSPSGYEDLGESWSIKFKCSACGQSQKEYGNDIGLLTRGDEKSSVLVDCQEASEEMVDRGFTVFATGETPVYIALNCGNLRDGATYDFKISDFVMIKSDSTLMIYADKEFTKNMVREDSGLVSLKAVWEADTLTMPLPERLGYQFMSWNTMADGSGISYEAGQKVVVDKDLKMYAIWQVSTIPPCNQTVEISDVAYLNESFTGHGFAVDELDEVGDFKYTATYTGENGCDSTVVLNLTVKERPLIIPTAFTPHFADDMNDHFMPGYEVYIYDRYGNLVCHSEDGWDGTYRGKVATAGVYVYTLVMKDGQMRKGTIEVVKAK